jgi:hypothetical protein
MSLTPKKKKTKHLNGMLHANVENAADLISNALELAKNMKDDGQKIRFKPLKTDLIWLEERLDGLRAMVSAKPKEARKDN